MNIPSFNGRYIVQGTAKQIQQFKNEYRNTTNLVNSTEQNICNKQDCNLIESISLSDIYYPEQEYAQEKCAKCSGAMIQKTGPYGPYLECVECKNRKKIEKSTGVKCPKCGEGEIVYKKSKYGKIFFGCNKYPNCDFVSWAEPVAEKCPECNSYLIKNITKTSKKLKCSNKECSFTKEIIEEEE